MIAETIVAQPLRDEIERTPFRERRPRFLDLDPSLALSSSLARLDALIRSILADPRALESRNLVAVAAQAGRQQHPAAHKGLIAEAIDRVQPWVEGAFGRTLAGAARIERRLSWTVVWPPGDPDAIVCTGKTEFLTRDPQGDWNAVVAAVAETSLPRERLRLQLAARAAAALGFGPIRHGWILRLGAGGGPIGEDRFDPLTIEDAIREVVDDASRASSACDRS
jgi:hypothetical protein